MKEDTDKHLSLILDTLKRWQEELAHPKQELTDIAKYSFTVEEDELFPYVLQHCPSIEKLYAKFKWLRDEEYKRQKALMESDKKLSSEDTTGIEEAIELEARISWKERKLQDHLDIIVYYCEQILPEIVNASLLSNECTKHKCDLCLNLES